jgi:hypothetical protein
MAIKKIIWLLSIAIAIAYGGYLISQSSHWGGWILSSLGGIAFLLVFFFYQKSVKDPILTSLPNRHSHLANRSVLSLERKADSLLGSSTKLWTSIYLSVAVIPTVAIVVAALMYPNVPPSNLSIWNLLDLYVVHAAIIYCIYSVAILFAHVYERSALDLYDFIYRNHG